MYGEQKHSKRRIVSLVLFLTVLAALAFGWLFRQDISDWYRLRDYQPSAEVVSLADQTTMTDSGRRIFYTTHPDVTGKDTFNTHCRQGNISEFSIVLGCYVSNGGLYGNMYLYDIDDPRLEGVKQVTAAHEMLHAAYERLSPKKRQEIDALLLDTYHSLPDGRVKQTVAQYEANDPSSVPSELHSILGSEQRDLPPKLEEYYKQYFSNRLAVVGFSEQYEAEFTKREAQVASYDAQLATLKGAIEANQAEIEAMRADLDQERSELDSLESQGNAAAFNARVAGYNQQVAAFNALVSETRSQIDEYNQLVEERNNLALEVQELTQAIDSRPEGL